MILAEQIELACLLEATARKVGNVHPAASFRDLDYADFVDAAQAIAHPLSQAQTCGLGQSILNAVKATREARVRSNANLGIILLFAPMAAIPSDVTLEIGIQDVLASTTVEDAELVYEAIRIAKPGGLGKTNNQDVQTKPSVTLLDAMKLAADRDRIAEQYATSFSFVLKRGLHWLMHDWTWHGMCPLTIFSRTGMRDEVPTAPWESAIKKLHLRIMADAPDSLIVRKCGLEEGTRIQKLSSELIDLDWPHAQQSWHRFDEFDIHLRSDGHRLNPGTSADLVAAVLFAAIRSSEILFPTRDVVLAHAERLVVFPKRSRPTN